MSMDWLQRARMLRDFQNGLQPRYGHDLNSHQLSLWKLKSVILVDLWVTVVFYLTAMHAPSLLVDLITRLWSFAMLLWHFENVVRASYPLCPI